jgi:hypothetical protein
MSVPELSDTLDALALDMLALEVLVSELVAPESLAEELLMEQLPTSDMLALEVVPCMGKTCTKPRSEINECFCWRTSLNKNDHFAAAFGRALTCHA